MLYTEWTGEWTEGDEMVMGGDEMMLADDDDDSMSASSLVST